MQLLGYGLDTKLFRTILYDFLYLRKTWKVDKRGRAEQAKAHCHYWDNPPVVGLGQRLGPFWVPVLMPEDVGHVLELSSDSTGTCRIATRIDTGQILS